MRTLGAWDVGLASSGSQTDFIRHGFLLSPTMLINNEVLNPSYLANDIHLILIWNINCMQVSLLAWVGRRQTRKDSGQKGKWLFLCGQDLSKAAMT